MEHEKKEKLKAEGYVFDDELQCYVNRAAGKIFSKPWLETQNLNTIHISLSLPHGPTTWKLHLNPDQPHEEIRISIYEKYGTRP